MTSAARPHVSRMTADDVPAAAAIDDPARMGEAHIREELARAWSVIWVARDEAGAVVAFLISWHVADELHVLNVATASSHRRRGFGRALMDAAVEFAKEHRLRHALLEARRSNHGAIALYRSVGFFAMGVRPRYYPDDEDAVEMVLLFDPETGEALRHEDEVRLD